MKQHKLHIFLVAAILLTIFCICTVFAASSNLVSAKKVAELQEKAAPIWAEHSESRQAGEAAELVEYQKPLGYALQYPKLGQEAIDARLAEIVAEMRNAFDQEYLPIMEEAAQNHKSTGDAPILYLTYETYLAEETQLTVVFFETHEVNAAVSPHTQIRMVHFDLAEGVEVAAEDLIWQDFAKNASAYAKTYFTSTPPYNEGLFGNYEALLAPDAGRFDRFALTEEGVLFYFDRYDLFPGSYGIVPLLIPYADMLTKETPAPAPAVDMPQSGERMVALTFDDGPHPTHTAAILDVLEQYGAKATFFDLGSLVERYPDIVRREAALGCEVGSHSYDHKNFNKLSAEAIRADVAATEAAFQAALGHSPASFRPPYGNCNANVKNLIPLPIYLWSVDTLDWKSRSAEAIMKAVKAEGDLDGKVILMHGIYASSAEATAQLVPYLQEQGYTLVTVSELIQSKHGETPQAGKLYGYSYFR